MAERETITNWVDGGTVAFALGGAGILVTSMITEPRMQPELGVYLLAKWASITATISGGTTAMIGLRMLYDQVQPHTHKGVNPHQHNAEDVKGIPPHRHEQKEVPHHEHKTEDLIVPTPPVVDIAEQNKQTVLRMWGEYGGREKLQKELEELDLDVRTTNAVKRNAHPLQRLPLTLAGLRMFKEQGISFKGRNIGPVITEQIKAALERTSIEVNGINYPTTVTETNQMVENGFIEKL